MNPELRQRITSAAVALCESAGLSVHWAPKCSLQSHRRSGTSIASNIKQKKPAKVQVEASNVATVDKAKSHHISSTAMVRLCHVKDLRRVAMLGMVWSLLNLRIPSPNFLSQVSRLHAPLKGQASRFAAGRPTPETEALTLRNFFGGNELDRLRRENAELKQKLEAEGGAEGGGLIEKIGNGIKSLFGGKKSAPLAERSSSMGILGALLQPAIGMLGNLFKDSQEDIGKVLSEVEVILARSGRLGSSVECGPIYSQSYSSMNINGRQSTQVQLQFQAKGDQRSGMATCSAAIQSNGVDIRSLTLDGQPVDQSSGSSGDVIDVER